jgi:hypothetical protein
VPEASHPQMCSVMGMGPRVVKHDIFSFPPVISTQAAGEWTCHLVVYSHVAFDSYV